MYDVGNVRVHVIIVTGNHDDTCVGADISDTSSGAYDIGACRTHPALYNDFRLSVLVEKAGGHEQEREIMYRIAIVDDDAGQCAGLHDMLRELIPAELDCGIDMYASLGELDGQQVDIVFADICLADGENAIEEVMQLFSDRPAVQVIYVTGHVEYCSAVYDTRHIGFLVKPVRRQELADAFHRALNRLCDLREQPFAVRFNNTSYVVRPAQVMYVESKLRVAVFHCENNGTVRTYMKLSDVAERLPSRFHRCHSSYLVNFDFVNAITKNDFVLTDGTHVPISHLRPHRYHAPLSAVRHNQ